MKRILSYLDRLGWVGFAFLCLIVPMGIGAQPWNPQIIWEREGAGDSSRYGGTIFGMGDQNDDGFDDFAVEAWGWGGPGQPNEAKTEFFHGGNPVSPNPYQTFVTLPNEYVLWNVESAGDVNGDSFVDWLIYKSPIDDLNLEVFELFFGGPNTDNLPDWGQEFSSPPFTIVPGFADVNGDGADDLFMYRNGVGYIYFGGILLDEAPDWVRHNPPEYPQQALAESFGDLNGDGFDDFLSVTHNGQQDWIHIFFGSLDPDTLPSIILSGGVDWGGTKIINDLNNDGRDDLVSDGDEVYSIRWGSENLSQTGDFELTNPCSLPWSEWEPVGIGDVNGDGIADLGVVEEYCSNNFWGNTSIYLGSRWMTASPRYTFWGRQTPSEIIGHRVVAGIGDVNGDGVDDFALGGFNSDFVGFRGRAVVVAGDSNVHAPLSDTAPAIVEGLNLTTFPNPFNSTLSISLSIPLHQAVTVSLYDLLGREVDVIHRGRLESVTISYAAPANLSSGVYFVRAATGTQTVMQKVVLLK